MASNFPNLITYIYKFFHCYIPCMSNKQIVHAWGDCCSQAVLLPDLPDRRHSWQQNSHTCPTVMWARPTSHFQITSILADKLSNLCFIVVVSCFLGHMVKGWPAWTVAEQWVSLTADVGWCSLTVHSSPPGCGWNVVAGGLNVELASLGVELWMRGRNFFMSNLWVVKMQPSNWEIRIHWDIDRKQNSSFSNTFLSSSFFKLPKSQSIITYNRHSKDYYHILCLH